MPLPHELPQRPDERVLRQLVAALIFEGIVPVRQSAGEGDIVFDWPQGQGRCR
ncbi:hypothetical protein P6U16_14895 [Rhizobium sp. 32-5/1]|uniref:hypothetical protein n=1 Tax=Rhizobium sp. 32-5/1 TaxID=3019602 RepID=UPI00240D32CB|nr:hypothetical protein [Rhizobium sp. 32-5/1]WEZ82405.1 hypothetical protein P6U16_14895 [Rhizobium sp. 32-5/1]